jgi:GTP-binding protein EngB required for normal cell division
MLKRMKRCYIKKGIDPEVDKSFLLNKLRTAKNLEFSCVGPKGVNLRTKLIISIDRERHIYIVDIAFPYFNWKEDSSTSWETIPEEYVKFRYRGIQ